MLVKACSIRFGGDWKRTAVVVMMAFHAVVLAWLGYVEAPTWHEPAQLTAGLAWWRFGRADVSRVNPPLVRTVAAAPILLLRPALDPSEFDRPPGGRDEFARAERFVKDNAAHLRLCFTLARWVCIAFSLAGAYFCWRFATALYGTYAGLTALTLWCFSPYILGHGATIMADVPAAAMGMAAMYVFWRWLKSPRWLEAFGAGVVLGLAELCKFTLLVFYPLLPILWLVYRMPERKTMTRRDWLRQGGMLAIALLISVYVINCGYLFEGTFTPLEDFHFQTTLFTGCDSLKDVPPEGANRFAGTWLGKMPVPIPANMLQGIDTQRYDFERGLPSYLRGQWAKHGWWYYYLYAMAIKVPLGFWGLVLLAIGVTLFRRGYNASWRDEMVVLAPFFTILIFVSSQTGFSVHSRYIIPVLPFLFVWTSKVARVFEMPARKLFAKTSDQQKNLTPRREGAKGHSLFAPLRLCVRLFSLRGAVVLLLMWSIGSSLWYYPHCLSYFNELVGGPIGGPKHLLDSNIDWGQDLFYLKDWLDANPDVKFDGLAVWGSYPATLAGIPETPMPPTDPAGGSATASEKGTGLICRNGPEGAAHELDQSPFPKPGWYALSVNYLYDRSGQYRYFLNFQPAATAGYSIYIYHITIEEANRVRRELGLPKLKEEGGGRKGEKVEKQLAMHMRGTG